MRVRAAQVQVRSARPVIVAVLLAVVASLAVAVPTAQARPSLDEVGVEPAGELTTSPGYGPGRLRNATPMTRGCIDTRSRRVQHRKPGQTCPAGSRSVDFKVTVATQLCLMPDRAVRSFKDRFACRERGGVHVRGLGNNKILFCAVPGRAVRWASKRQRCVRPEKAFTLRNHRPVELTLAGGVVEENAGRDAVVGLLHAVDVDPGDSQRYALVPGPGSDDNALFRISEGRLLARADLDHETAETLRVRVRVRDFRRGRLVRPFAVTVADVNEAPTGLALDGSTVVENEPAGTEVGRLSATDPDRGDVLTWTLLETGDHDDFTLDGDRLLTAAPLDHEEAATRTLRVAVTDAAGLSQEREFSVDVTDVNEAPTALTLTRDVVAENAPADTLVGRFEVVDVDAGPPYRFEILPGDDAALFAVDGDALRTVAPLDHEEAPVRSVRVRVTDTDGLTLTRTLRVHVADVNEAPTAPELSNDTITENEAAGTVVGTLSSSDPDDGDEPTFTLAAGAGDDDNAAFEVVDGELRTRRSFDFETRRTYAVRVRASDGDLHTESAFSITVLDIDEAPTAVRLETDEIDENVTGVVGRLLADDEEGDVLTWSLVAGTGDTDNASFEVVGDELRTVRGLDHEAGATRSVRVRVTDGTTPVVAVLTVTVSDVNEAPSLLRLSEDTVDENVTGVLGTLAAQDPDAGDVLTYALVAGAGDDDNAAFEVVGEEVRIPAGLDFEAGSTRTIRVAARDRAGLVVERTFTLTVRDVNEAPSLPALDTTSVDENATDALVGTLTSTDPDAGTTLTFSLVPGTGDTHNDQFVVVGDRLRVRGSLDFEAGATRSVRIRVSDGDLTATRHFTITVNDRNDAPTALALTPGEVAENAAATFVGELSADDQDGDTLSWALVAGDGDTDNAAFQVVGVELRTRAGLDFEAGATRSVRLEVNDGETLVQRAFTVTVIDVNEAPSGLALSPRVVDENAAGVRVGTLGASDPDAGASLTYALVPGAGSADNAAFEVVGVELRTRAGLDFEAGATRTVRVEVTDGALSQQQQFTVTVRDRNDAPSAITLAPARIRLDAEVGDVVGTLSAADQDAAPAHVFTDTSVEGTHTGHGFFAVDGDRITVARPLDSLATGVVELRVRVDDPWPSDSAQDTSREEVLEAEVLSGRSISLDAATIDENNAVGAEVGTLSYVDPLATGPVTYALVPGALDNADFEVADDRLVATTSFDHESTPVRRIRVRASAGASSFTQDLEVAVADVDEAPTGLALGNATVAENALQAQVGVLSAVDPEGRPTTFSLVAGAGDTHNSEFAVVGDVLRTSLALDFEAGATRSVRIRVSDGTTWAERQFTVMVLDRNDAPTSVTLDTTEAYDSAAVGSVVGRLSAADVDAQKPHTFAIVAGSDPEGLFALVGDELRWARSPLGIDGERSVTVRVSDTWGGVTHTLDDELTVTVGPDTRLALTLDDDAVDENSPVGTAVGTLQASGAGIGTGPWTYALVPGAAQNADFALQGNQLVTATVLDHETRPTATVRVRVSDAAGRAWLRDLTVRIADVDEPPVWGTTSVSAHENSIAGIWPNVTDPEGASVTLSLQTCDGFVDENHRFTLIPGIGAQRTTPMDFEDPTNNAMRLCLGASDGTLMSKKSFTVMALDVNEPTTDIRIDTAVVDVAAPVGTVVGTLTAVDPDARKPDFSIVDGTGDFEVVGNELRVARDLGALPLGPVTVRVRAADSWSPLGGPLAQSFEKDLTIRVARPLVLTAPDGAVDENLPAGAVVSTLAASGGEEPWTYALDGAGDDNALFEVVGDEMRTRRPLDHEGDGATLTARVKVTDGTDESVSRTVTVTVDDVNEAPTALTSTGGTVAENQPAATTVRTFAVNDPDEGDTHTFSLVPGSGDTDNALFAISGTRLVTSAGLDHESQGSLSVRVRATDSGGLHVDQTFTVTVTDVAEAPTGLTPTSLDVEERQPAGTAVGSVSVVDQDADESHTLVVLGGVPFEFVGRQLRTTAELDYDDRTSWTFDVRVTDQDGLSVVTELTVAVIDVVFAPVPRADSLTGVIGNTRASSTTSVLANDTDPEGGTLAVTDGDLTTTRGGTVTMASDGTYRYDPPVGVKAVTDSVTYEVTSSESGLTATGSLDLTITDRLVWYVTPGQQGNGTSHAPYGAVTPIAGNSTTDRDSPGDEIFLADGTHDRLQLEAGQKVYGAQRGLPGLVSAVPTASARVRTTSGDAALQLAEGALVDGVVLETLGSGPALRADGVNAATVTDRSRIEATVGPGVVVNGGTASSLVVAAGVRAQGAAAVTVTSRQGTTSFTGLVESSTTTAGQRGVVLTAAGAVSFTGGVQVQSPGAAFTATGGGTVTVTGSANWLHSTQDAALHVAQTTVGAGGLTFQRLQSGGTAVGVSLTNTGAGALTVTGGQGVTRSSVKGIKLDTTAGATLTAVDVSSAGSGRPAVDVDTLNGPLRLTNVVVTGAATHGVDVNGTTAPVTLQGSTVSGSGDSGVVVASAAGTSAVTVTNSTITGSGATGVARDGLRVESSGTAAITTTVTGSTITDNAGDQVQVVVTGLGVSRATVTENTLHGSGRGVVVTGGGAGFFGTLHYVVARNQLLRTTGTALAVTTHGNGRGTVTGHLEGNTVGGSGGTCEIGVLVDAEGLPTLVANVADNVLVGCASPLTAQGADLGSQLHLTLKGNTISGTTAPLSVRFGRVGMTDPIGLTCLDYGTNFGAHLSVDIAAGTVGLPGHTGPVEVAPVRSYLTARAAPDVPEVLVRVPELSSTSVPCLVPPS